MRSNQLSQSNSRRGAAAVEFALASSVLLMMVFASIEFVRLNMMKHAVEAKPQRASVALVDERDQVLFRAKASVDAKRVDDVVSMCL